VVTARGTLDETVTLELRDLLFPLVTAGDASVVVDLREVLELDPAPLGVVVSAAHMLERRGRRLTLVATSRHLTELVHASGLDRVAQLERSLDRGLTHAH
jgi:anti-anti-sigma factor